MDLDAVLVAASGALAGRRWDISAEGLTLGRDDGCAVSLPDDGVSREHARIFVHNSAVWVQDQGSRNGVFVNGKRIVRPKSVTPGDEIGVGAHVFSIEVGGFEQSVSMVRPVLESGSGTSGGAGKAPAMVAALVIGLLGAVGIAIWFAFGAS